MVVTTSQSYANPTPSSTGGPSDGDGDTRIGRKILYSVVSMFLFYVMNALVVICVWRMYQKKPDVRGRKCQESCDVEQPSAGAALSNFIVLCVGVSKAPPVLSHS